MPTIARTQTCCFTGHRPQHLPWHHNLSDPRCIAVKELLRREIEAAYQNGYRRFICGMARGSDLMAGELVAEAKACHPDIVLEAAIPCEGQTHGWTKAEVARYQALLTQCDIVPAYLPTYDKTSMMRRNQYMVEESSLIIAVFSGTPGGTRNTLAFALQNGLRAIMIDPEESEEPRTEIAGNLAPDDRSPSLSE